MREITKMITLPAGDEMMAFRLTKPDAFSGGRLLKLLSAAQGKAEGSLTLWDGKGRLELTVPRSHRGQVDRFRTASEGGRPLLH